jgi:hypothetical protein
MTDGERASRRAGVRREHEPARLIEPSQKHTCRETTNATAPCEVRISVAPRRSVAGMASPSRMTLSSHLRNMGSPRRNEKPAMNKLITLGSMVENSVA